MPGKRTRRRRGHPRGKALGFHGLRPASKGSDTGGSQPSAPSTPSTTGASTTGEGSGD